MRRKNLPDKICEYCGKSYNRTIIKNKKSNRKIESVCQYLKKRKFCSRKCYDASKVKPFVDDVKRCAFAGCGRILQRKRDKNGKQLGYNQYKRQIYCDRECWRKAVATRNGKALCFYCGKLIPKQSHGHTNRRFCNRLHYNHFIRLAKQFGVIQTSLSATAAALRGKAVLWRQSVKRQSV